ncbi:AAA family ATPase [Lentzea sp. NPDC003310]|uniref:helix-turn-helix transcriptional regulator n=1 Tax=Lentzea sp. NPDC003310 TaxID=3154447 RepID=UPI0033A33FB1
MPGAQPSSTPAVLVGRAAELGRSRSVVVGCRPALVQVEGEAGVGKSRLVGELVAGVAGVVPVVLTGRCQRTPEPFVLGPVLEALRGLRHVLAGCELSPVTAALRAVVPELACVLPAPVTAADPRFDRHLLFRALREVLSVTGPTLLVVEDLHWADEATLAFLRFLLSDPPARLAVVVTFRREDVVGGMPLGTAFRPGAGVTTEIVELTALDVAQVGELAAAVLGVEAVGEAVATELHERTGGLPFCVEEVLRAPDDGGVPVRVRESVAERVAALTPDARRLVHAASVFTAPVTASRLGEMADLSGQRLRAAVDEAVARPILHQQEEGTYWFRHGLARRAVYRAVGAMHRAELHARAVRLLAATDPPPLLQLAEHSRLAHRRADLLSYGERAADQALAAADAATATSLLRQLLAEEPLSGEEVDRLGRKLGEAALLGLDVAASVAVLHPLLADERLSPAARGEVRMHLGLLLARQSDTLAEGRAQLELAVADLAGRPDLAARCVSALAQPFNGDAPLPSLTRWLHEADAIAGRCEDGELRISLVANVVGSLVAVGDPDVLDRLDTLPQAGRTPGEQRQVARAHCNLADSLTIVGRFDQAAGHLRLGMKAAQDSGARYVLSTARSTQVRLSWFTGEWHGLAARATSLLAEHHGLVAVASELHLVLGLLALARGQWAAAATHLELTGARTPRDAVTPVALSGSAGLVRLALRDDDVPRAVHEAGAGLALARRKQVWAWAGDLAEAAVDAYLAAGRTHDAEAVVRDVEDGLAGVSAPLTAAALHTCRGALAVHAGGDGTPCFTAAARAYDDRGAPYLAALAWERADSALLRRGGPAAIAAHTRCAERFEALDATHDAARCRHLLRGLGVTTPSRRGSRGYGDDLSPREREVARLLVTGLTNNQIAEVLFLSPRTVEQHTSSVLRKLGLGSRRAIRSSHLT